MASNEWYLDNKQEVLIAIMKAVRGGIVEFPVARVQCKEENDDGTVEQTIGRGTRSLSGCLPKETHAHCRLIQEIALCDIKSIHCLITI